MLSKSNENIDISVFKSTNKTLYPYFYLKRTFDIIFSCLLLFFVIPIIIIFALLIKLDSPGPVFYSQERVGLKGKKIFITKLRSMNVNAESNGPQWALQNDNRVTRVGKFLRNTRVDELPQLFSVIKGDLSLIGPRPERPVFHNKFCDEINGFEERIEILPGLSGLAQVNGGYDVTPEEKLILDLEYISKFSLKQDIKIFYNTLVVVFTGNGAR